jgi:hypothetical protein
VDILAYRSQTGNEISDIEDEEPLWFAAAAGAFGDKLGLG